VDLIGPDYDRPSTDPAGQTLIICSAPRTGSYELCRYLLAAGIGVPHEYFNPNYAWRLAERWGFARNPLEPSELSRYVVALRMRRGQNGVFATKLQFPHFDRILRNDEGGGRSCRTFQADSFRRGDVSGAREFPVDPITIVLLWRG
jgi:LPS sulfotransferase NodH